MGPNTHYPLHVLPTKDSVDMVVLGIRTRTGSDDTVLVTWSNASQECYYIDSQKMVNIHSRV